MLRFSMGGVLQILTWGETVWAASRQGCFRSSLPARIAASAHATPMTYEIGGKQYVVIAAGGSAKVEEERQSDAVVAYALP